MTAGKYDLAIEQGATLGLTLTWADETNAPVNLTGYTARLQVRRTVDDDNVLLSLTTENGGIALGGSAGTVTLSATAATTASLTVGPAVYDLELISSGGVVTRLLEGNVVLRRNVTR